MGNSTSFSALLSSRASRRGAPKTPLQAPATMGLTLGMGYDSLDHRQEGLEEEEDSTQATGAATDEGMKEEEVNEARKVNEARTSRCLGRRVANVLLMCC